ncbi:MAG: GNAT family N-acetyltransferase [Candidatus Pacebacteria bacterium]|nr:GNAT family N-acetyltransferase [Candidatus Paceibacterota bacterium]
MKKISQLKIRRAEMSDIRPFYELFKHCLKTQFPHYSSKTINAYLKKYFTRENIAFDLRRKIVDLLLAFVGEEVAGYILTNPPYGGVVYISWFSVKDSFQGHGIGSALLKEYEKIAKKRKIHKIHLWTDERNVKFYKKKKWILVGHVPDNYFGSEDYLFYKTIQKSNY